MRRLVVTGAIVALGLSMSGMAVGQVINGVIFGTTADATGALIPGVEVTATQTATGVVTRAVSNESGAYRFPSLQPGPYEVSASLPGFQTQTFRLNLGTAQQISRNFTLQVGAVTQTIEVAVAADELLTTSTLSVAETLGSQELVDLPLVGRNVMDIATLTAAGVQGNGGTGTTFAGIEAGGSRNLNIQVDGMTVNNGRHEQGLAAATHINPDMIDEVRVVVAAVDVESLGSAQFQVRTKSGTNEYHGALVWNYRNSALDANSWSNNRLGTDKTWYSRHQYTASLGGPIIRNRTFFFALFDGQRGLSKESEDAVVLTPLARQGIFRFFPGVNNGNADASVSGSGNTLRAPVVDAAGNPLDWTQIPGATGPMQSINVFAVGDPSRTGIDPVYMQRLIADMPLPNAYDGPQTIGGVPVDGLNTAVIRWTRRAVATSGVGSGADPDAFNRKQINVKIDHNFSNDHRLMGSWSREHRFSDNNETSPWPNGWGGTATTDPSTLTLQFTSVLSPTVLSEFKFGRRVTTLHYLPSYTTEPYAEEAWNYMPVINDIPVLFHPSLFTENMLGCSGYCGDLNNKSPLNSFTETVSWTRGVHAMKFGVEVRRANTFAAQPNVIIPHVYGGAGDVPVVGIDTIPGLLPANQSLAEDVLLSLSGSVNDSRERFEIREPTDTQFRDFRDTYFHPDNPENFYGRIRDWHQNEFNFFVKDDWQVTPNLTLNLGIRYDLMQVPYLKSASGENFTPGLLGGNATAFGYSGRDFSAWMSGGTPRQADDTQTVLIGPGSAYPDQGIWKSDRNNWAPAIGFAWSPDYWGEDQTTIRGGYQIAYQLPGPGLVWVDLKYGNLPGFFYEPTDFGDGSFRNFSNVDIPLAIDQQPYEPIPLTQRSQTLRVVDENFATPYVQSFTLGITRSLSRNVTLDIKYVGTRGVKLQEDMNINAADFRNNGLLAALETTRAGGDAPLFDQMMGGLNVGSGVVGVNVSGSQALRLHPSTRTAIANGDFVTVAEWLNTTNAGTVQPPLTNGGLLRSSGQFPENFIVANPQFGSVFLDTNIDHSTYHSLQTQVNVRATEGINYQATYTWSKNLGVFAGGGEGYRDPTNAAADYTLQANHRTHAFRSFGTFRLPFGPGRTFGGGTTGWLARMIEGWQAGMVFNLTSGAPLTVGAGNTLYTGGTPDIAGDFTRDGQVVWTEGDTFGNYFGEGYERVTDPACGALPTVLRPRCTISALADGNGNIVLQHPGPGEYGTLGFNTLEGPGSWDLDMNFQKAVQIDESRTFTLRMDARNIFNHPTPGNPNLNVNSGIFGEIRTKTGSRTMQVQLRLDF